MVQEKYQEEKACDRRHPYCIKIIIIIIIILFTAIGLSPGGSGYFTCKQNMKLVTTKFKSGGLHEKHVVATWNLTAFPLQQRLHERASTLRYTYSTLPVLCNGIASTQSHNTVE